MGSVADSIMETSSRGMEAGEDQPQRKFVVLNRIRSIESDALFSDGDQVFIQHRGEQYLLRRTRNGKLILTK
jgi:hemin uptake protein HemP